MTLFASLRASLVFPVGLMLALLGPYCATNALASPRHVRSLSRTMGQDGQGKVLYLEHCKSCHGVLGAPPKLLVTKYEKIPNLTDPAFFAGRSDDSLVVVLQKGTGGHMKSFADKLSTDGMRAVAMYIRTLAQPH